MTKNNPVNNSDRIKGAWILDSKSAELIEEKDILIEGNKIEPICPKTIAANSAAVIVCRIGTLMPGLVDVFVHKCGT